MTQSFTQFRSQHRDHCISGWSRTGCQCTDCIRRYLKDVLGCPTNTLDWIAGGNAVDFLRNMNPAHFTIVKNAPNNHPPDGAIVVAAHTDSHGNAFGHVLISLGSTVYVVRGFSQNWTRYRLCEYEFHPHYNDTNWHVLGWGIPRMHFVL